MGVSEITCLRNDAEHHLGRATARLLDLAGDDGAWRGTFEIGAFADAVDVIHRHFMGTTTADGLARAAARIRSEQRADGTWAAYEGGPGALMNTVAAYVALRLAGAGERDPSLDRARRFILDGGGLETVPPQLGVWLAMLGLYDWRALPAVPPELLLVPGAVPVSLHHMAWWIRTLVVPITVCTAIRPTRPCGLDLGELRTGGRPAPFGDVAPPFRLLLGSLRAYRALPVNLLRPAALRACKQWLLQHQDASGHFGGGLLFATQLSTAALAALGCSNDDPPVRAALDAIDRLVVEEEGHRHVQFCSAGIADTAMVLNSLLDAGVSIDAPAVGRGTRWLVTQQALFEVPGRPRHLHGGWGWQDGNQLSPDVDDTAFAATALRRRSGHDDPVVEQAVERAVAWAFSLQASSGGWHAFERARTRSLPTDPLLERNELIDGPAPDVTARAIEWLVDEGHGDDPRIVRALDWLLGQQQPDGRWDSRWGCALMTTASCTRALAWMGRDLGDDAARRAVDWLVVRQNDDGGWGESPEAFRDPEGIGHGASTVQQTSLVLLGLLPLVPADNGVVVRAVEHLVAHAAADPNVFDERAFCFPVSKTFDLWWRNRLWPLLYGARALAAFVHAAKDATATIDLRDVAGDAQLLRRDEHALARRP